MRNKKLDDEIEYEEHIKIFGKKLFDLRIANKLSLKEVADKIKIPPHKLAGIEKGRIWFTIPILFELAFLYGFEPRDFLKIQNSKSRNKKTMP